jgi:hypothetical protein
MPSPDPLSDPVPLRRNGRGKGWTLLAALLGFAVFGAAALVFTDDARWLRLGIVAALWAALVGAFAAARYRREATGGQDRGEELRRMYQLELEREVAARREYELQVETDTRRRLEEETRNEVRGELDGLRTELHTLRQNLEALLGGEVLVERVALRTESTRLRSLSDQSRAARSADRALPKGTSRPGQPWRSGVPSDIQDAEIIEQRPSSSAATPHHESVPSQPPRSEPPRTQPPRAEPAWPERSEPRRVDSVWWERPEPRRTEPAWPEWIQARPSRTDDAPPPPVEPSERTDILPRYQAHAEPPGATPAAARHETSQPLDFQPLPPPEPARPEPARPEPRSAEPAATEQPLWSALNAQPRVTSTPQQRPEPPMADPVYADPLTSPRWDRFDSWTPSQPGPAGPIEAAAAAAAHGYGTSGPTGGPSRTEDEHAVQGPTGRHRHAADEDTGSHTTGRRPVNELIAFLSNNPQGRRRHRRDDE